MARIIVCGWRNVKEGLPVERANADFLQSERPRIINLALPGGVEYMDRVTENNMDKQPLTRRYGHLRGQQDATPEDIRSARLHPAPVVIPRPIALPVGGRTDGEGWEW